MLITAEAYRWIAKLLMNAGPAEPFSLTLTGNARRFYWWSQPRVQSPICDFSSKAI